MVGFEVDGVREEPDGLVIIFGAKVDATEGDSDIGVDRIKLNGLAVGGQSPGIGTLGQGQKAAINAGQVFHIGNLGGIEGDGVFGFADGLLNELGDGGAFFGGELGFAGGQGAG